MQLIYEKVDANMKRDMDLVRELLVNIEDNPRLDGTGYATIQKPEELGIVNYSIEEVNYHLVLLIEAGYLKGKIGMDVSGRNLPTFSKLTWQGHEFVDDIKDSSIWEKTKERMQGLSSVGLAVVAEIAKAEIKKKLGLP